MSGLFPSLSDEQFRIIRQPLDAKIFLEGPAGAGKTTVGVERLLHLVDSGVPGQSILVLVPQRTLAQPYYRAIRQPGLTASGMISILTMGGLARRMIDLFWPLIAEEAGFTSREERPIFLTLETAQYYMAHQVRPLLEKGLFDWYKMAYSKRITLPIPIEKEDLDAEWDGVQCFTLPETMDKIIRRYKGLDN